MLLINAVVAARALFIFLACCCFTGQPVGVLSHQLHRPQVAILCHLFNIKDKSEISEHFKSQINYDAPRDFVKNKFRQN